MPIKDPSRPTLKDRKLNSDKTSVDKTDDKAKRQRFASRADTRAFGNREFTDRVEAALDRGDTTEAKRIAEQADGAEREYYLQMAREERDSVEARIGRLLSRSRGSTDRFDGAGGDIRHVRNRIQELAERRRKRAGGPSPYMRKKD